MLATGTASGKSLVYQLAFAQAALTVPKATALFLFLVARPASVFIGLIGTTQAVELAFVLAAGSIGFLVFNSRTTDHQSHLRTRPESGTYNY